MMKEFFGFASFCVLVIILFKLMIMQAESPESIAKQEKFHKDRLTETQLAISSTPGLEDCTYQEVKSMSIVRCPNSETKVEVTSGKYHHETLTVVK